MGGPRPHPYPCAASTNMVSAMATISTIRSFMVPTSSHGDVSGHRVLDRRNSDGVAAVGSGLGLDDHWTNRHLST